MSNPIKIKETISISKNEILAKHSQMNQYFMDCIKALYGECVQGVDIKCFLPCNIIKASKQNNYSVLEDLKKKSGCYIFLNKEQIPVYIGIGGKVLNKQDLYKRITQELSSYVKKGSNQKTEYAKNSGATLSKNIQEIDALLTNNQVSPDDSVETIKTFGLITINVGSITVKNSVNNSQALESILIALFHPKYNK